MQRDKMYNNWVVDKISLNVLPMLLNSLTKDGFAIWQVINLDGTNFLVIAQKTSPEITWLIPPTKNQVDSPQP